MAPTSKPTYKYTAPRCPYGSLSLSLSPPCACETVSGLLRGAAEHRSSGGGAAAVSSPSSILSPPSGSPFFTSPPPKKSSPSPAPSCYLLLRTVSHLPGLSGKTHLGGPEVTVADPVLTARAGIAVVMDTSHHYPWLNFSLAHHCDLEEEERGAAAELAAIAGAAPPPKLEDFLGGAGSGGGAPVTAHETAAEMYDSDLKFIAAAGFLSGSATPSTTVPSSLDQADPKLALPAAAAPAPEQRKAVDSFGQRTSIYRGVTRHRWTGRYEAHLWDNSCRREGQSRKGRQVYLGGYDKEEKAARAYDLAALKYWGSSTTTNFPVAEYEKELEEMKSMTRQEFVASLRRKSSGFSRGASIYRGVTRHHQHGRWQARIGRVAGNKDLYLGTFSTEEEAAEAYDIAAIKFRGLNAVTNFEISRYNVESIINSNLPIGSMSATGRSAKALESTPSSSSDAMPVEASTAPLFAALPVKYDQQDYLSMLALQHHQQGNLQGLGFGLYSSGVNLDFASSHGTASSMAHCYASGSVASHEHHQQLQDQQADEAQQSSSSCSSLPFATPIAFSGSYESSMTPGTFGYSYPNVAAFQTPIYGME